MKKETIAAKQTVIDKVSEDFKNASSVTLIEFRGLTVHETEELRHLLRKEDAILKVYKNTLVD